MKNITIKLLSVAVIASTISIAALSSAPVYAVDGWTQGCEGGDYVYRNGESYLIVHNSSRCT
jgi:hypothetical protein